MKKIILIFLVVFIGFSNLLPAQETNAGEDYSSYLPEIRNWNKNFFHLPYKTILTPQGLKDARTQMNSYANQKTVLKPVIENIELDGRHISVRIFKPDTIRAVVLDIHGGGWSVGIAAIDDGFNDELARRCNVAVVSVDYGLSPENAFPGPILDCRAAAKWLVRHAQEKFGTNKLFISGASAGAHLSAVTAIYIRDSLHAGNQLAGINLIYGAYDLGRTPSVRQATDTSFLPKKNFEELFQLIFKGWTIEQLQNPSYSPLFADLKSLCPALFTIGTADPLLDDTYFMEARWHEAGNKTFLASYPECPHGFNVFPTKIAKIANERMLSWMNGILDHP
jgi:acetyl esterase